MRANPRLMVFSTSVVFSNSATPNSPKQTVKARDEAVLAGFMAALGDLKAMRLSEGAALNRVLGDQIDRIEALTLAVEADPSRSPKRSARVLRTSYRR
jgi:uncharacterized protein YicC (UPF0701 family)